MEKIINDGIGRNYPEENEDERVKIAQLLSEPDEASQSISVEGVELDM